MMKPNYRSNLMSSKILMHIVQAKLKVNKIKSFTHIRLRVKSVIVKP